MSDLRKAAQQALETLVAMPLIWHKQTEAITALKAALTQEQPEPVVKQEYEYGIDEDTGKVK